MMKMNKREILWRVGIPFAVAVLAGSMAFGGAVLAGKVELRRGTGEPLPADAPAEGVGRVPVAARCNPRIGVDGFDAVEYLYLSAVCADDAETARVLETYTEWEGTAPEWYHPWEPMAAEWEDDSLSRCGGSSLGEGAIRDIGCPDWNVETSVIGWDGRRAEAWELDLYSRIVYLEFWGTSAECVEAGADSVLRMWEAGYFGSTLGETLTARADNGALVYSTYGFVWDVEYDAAGLSEIREVCEERFFSGPEWEAPFFQLYGWPDWAEPCYVIDGVYFSTEAR